jgi:hypothetical protein
LLKGRTNDSFRKARVAALLLFCGTVVLTAVLGLRSSRKTGLR